MAKIEIRISCTCAKDIFHGKGKERNERIKIRMDDKDIRIDTCDVQQIRGLSTFDTRTQAYTKELGAVMKRTQPDTIGQRYSADAVDAKSCKAEETKKRIRTETIDRDRARCRWMQTICGKYQDANAFKHKKVISMNWNEDCTWTKSYLINLHYVYLYI